jgi:hypothetical protein
LSTKTNTLVKLPKFDYSSLDFESIIADVQRLILEHPEYYTAYDDFLETDAGKMLIELTAFIMEKFTSKLDWTAREMFIGTATQRQSQINILQLINYKPKLPTGSFVKVDAKIIKWNEPFSLPNRFSVIGKSTTGENINFECLEIADDGKPNYNFIFNADTGTEDNKIKDIYNIPFYQGSTRIETDIYTDGVSNETYTLSGYPVIENSIRIFSETTHKECIEVESFISPEAQQADELNETLKRIPYMVKIDADNKAQIVFGHNNIVVIPNKDEKFTIYYRVGGGLQTNITKGSISSTKTITDEKGNRISLILTNEQKAYGGSNGEDLDEAKSIAPLSLRSANKTVTNEDYIAHLESNLIVKHAKIISKENEPEDIYNEYGYFLPSLDTWIYITPEVPELDNINPLDYNRSLQLSKPYIDNGFVYYEDFEFNPEINGQIRYLKSLHTYQFYDKYLVNLDEGMSGTRFNENEDYTIDYTYSEISRIQTSDDGKIPAGIVPMRIYYLKGTADNFVSKCFRIFVNNQIVLSDNASINLYPGIPIVMYNNKLNTIYQLNKDYTLDFAHNIIELTPGSSIQNGNTVFVTYADYYDTTGTSEELSILNSIKNKKMLCVDNHIKDSRYSTFDLVATVYCYKNLRGQVQDELPKLVREKFNINNICYDYPISKAEIIAFIMEQDGVRFVEIDYLGHDYYLYYKYMKGDCGLLELKEGNADKVEHKIIPKYNEIITLAWDEWEGHHTTESQRHGLILKFVEG